MKVLPALKGCVSDCTLPMTPPACTQLELVNGIVILCIAAEDGLCEQVGDLVMMSGCCADSGKFLQVWVPSIWPNVERIEVRGSDGVRAFEQELAGKSTASSSRNAYTYAEVHPPSD